MARDDFTDLPGDDGVPIFPESRVVAERVVLRPFTEADVTGNQRACGDPVTQYWTSIPASYTLDDSRDWCLLLSKEVRAMGEGVAFAVADRESDQYLGTVNLKRTDWEARVTEVGYLGAPWARGRGYITEAVAALARWLFTDQGFARLELKAAPGNRASQRVAERVGFTREGLLRGAGVIKSGRIDLVIYGLLPGDLG
ncbi:MAG TPA: GNAT family N-acetyltransferase [Streptosporangiaceae bacterium]|jgi:RimJ/RimL family protein N-acetyltransferase